MVIMMKLSIGKSLSLMLNRYSLHCNIIAIHYRARVIGGSDTLSTYKIMGIIENWKENDGTFLYGSGRKKRIWVTSHCPLKISSFTAEIC